MIGKSLLLFLTTLPLLGTPKWLTPPVPDSPAVNQLRTDGNACGPACLLDAFRSGDEKWRLSAARIKGDSDAKKVRQIVLDFGRRPSQLDPKRARWNGRVGIASVDLVAMANEMRGERWMRTVKQEVFFKAHRQTDEKLLKYVHRSLARSLKRGLPPILKVRRAALRTPPGGDRKAWLTLKSHFLVLTGLPAKLPRGARSFTVTYHDPWGGKKLRGVIRVPDVSTANLATLVADFPESKIGRGLIKPGEASCLSLTSAIGLF